MRILSILLALVWLSISVGAAMAIPSALYDPASGRVIVSNDQRIAIHWVLKSGARDPYQFGEGTNLSGQPLDIPGAYKDLSDLPGNLVYLNVPEGQFNIGFVVTPGTPASDLSVIWDEVSGIGAVDLGKVIVIPEPVAVRICLVLVCFTGFVAPKRPRGSTDVPVCGFRRIGTRCDSPGRSLGLEARFTRLAL